MKEKYFKVFILLSITVLILSFVSVSISAKEENKIKEPLDKITFIHYKDGTARALKNNVKTDSCYKLLGVKWNYLPVNYVINPSNLQNLSIDFITSTISASAETWDSATSKELLNDVYGVSFGPETAFGLQNYVNSISFGNYGSAEVIAITTIWYTRVGKQIVEFDMMFDTDFRWGDALINPSLMDLQNIATHEFGHAVGLGDLYTSSCSAVTMYGYSWNGDVEKRTLKQPDITGLQKMY